MEERPTAAPSPATAPEAAPSDRTPTSRVTIRRFQPEDADAVGRLTISAYDTYGTIGGQYRDYLADPARRADGCNALLVAELDGEVVGTVTFVLPGDPEWEERARLAGDAGFRVLAVGPAAQGRGVGTALVAACLRRARDRGRRRMVITSMEWMTRAHRLYEAFGFVRRPDLDVRFPGGVGLGFTLDLTSDAPDHFPPAGPVPDEPPWFEDVRT